MIWLIVLLFVSVGAYFLFRDTMNRLQYVQTIRLYWITRDTVAPGTPFVCRAFMRQTKEPWWSGSGIQFRLSKYTFQIGVLRSRSGGLLDQLGGRYMEDDPKTIRDWGNRETADSA